MVIFGYEEHGLPLKFKLFPEYLKKYNYRTYGVGKYGSITLHHW